jgi:hypothetical protein
VAEAGRLNVEEVRQEFLHMARPGGYWAASNAAYVDQGPGEQDEYLMAFRLAPDGLSIAGCMWGFVDGARSGPFWYFFRAWDPTTGSVLAYQSSPGGAVAIGREVSWPEGGREAVQALQFPGGDIQSVRHLNEFVTPDSLWSRSFRMSDGETDWTPQREYVWIWTPSEATPPC